MSTEFSLKKKSVQGFLKVVLGNSLAAQWTATFIKRSYRFFLCGSSGAPVNLMESY